MRAIVILTACAVVSMGVGAEDFSVEKTDKELIVKSGDAIWISTQTPTFDKDQREQTYKVFTHVYDFDGKAPITKGAGGKYTHHRGLFIGWKDTLVGGEDYDTWHMPNCYQRHVEWLTAEGGPKKAVQRERIDWCDDNGKPFIEETRVITVSPGKNGLRVIDFESTLTSVAGPIKLRGDLQHAGMQVRMDNEVVDHQDTTQYTLPDGAEELDNDKVVGAWWMCCSPVVRDKRYWLVHMTHPDLVTGEPVYSIRRYARFGAFFEPDLEEGKPLTLRFRVIVSENELDQAACASLYKAYCLSAR